ncbi:MAG: hypothetical protein ACLVJ6_11095 [Merdibacter sp.]
MHAQNQIGGLSCYALSMDVPGRIGLRAWKGGRVIAGGSSGNSDTGSCADEKNLIIRAVSEKVKEA